MMLDALIKSTVLLLLVGTACLLLRRQSAALRHLLWTMGIVGMIAIPILTVWSPFRLHLLPSLAARATVAQDDLRPPTRDATTADEDPVAAPAPETAPPLAAPDTRPTLLTVGNVLLVAWLAGTLLLLAQFLAGLIVVRRIARRAREVTDESWCALADGAARSVGITAPVEMRASGDVEMPFACGITRPVIVIPASASEWTP